jgi:hypothetical protein
MNPRDEENTYTNPELPKEDPHRMARQVAQAVLIEWILHYGNPADDATKLRQIKLVME